MTYSCNVCGDEFNSRSSLHQHLEDRKHIECPDCEDTFGSFSALNQHRNSVH